MLTPGPEHHTELQSLKIILLVLIIIVAEKLTLIVFWCFPPVDQLIDEAADEAEKTGAVEDDVATERPPGQRQSVGAGQ